MPRSRKCTTNQCTGASRRIEEVTLRNPSREYHIVFTTGRKPPNNHMLFKVDLRDGNSYALDLLGSQYGYYRVVTLWEEYREVLMTQGMVNYSPLGNYAATSLGLERAYRRRPVVWSYDDISVLVQCYLTHCVNAASDAWVSHVGSRMVSRNGSGLKKLSNSRISI